MCRGILLSPELTKVDCWGSMLGVWSIVSTFVTFAADFYNCHRQMAAHIRYLAQRQKICSATKEFPQLEAQSPARENHPLDAMRSGSTA